MKTRRLITHLTEEQMKILEARTISSGFISKSDYVRSLLFLKKPLTEQLEELIHELKKQKPNHKHPRQTMEQNKKRM